MLAVTFGKTEARWTGAGKYTGNIIMFLGRQVDHHREGVALLVRKHNCVALLEWKPINNKLLHSRFNSKFVKRSTITAFATTEDAQEDATKP